LAPLLGQIESWLERAVEGGARAVFRQRLQPIELAKAAAREMRRTPMVGPEGMEVPNAFTISLEPLSADECDELIDNLLGSAELEGDVRARIADAAGGTPLFVEEMVAKLIDDGVLTRSDGRWVATTDLSHVPVPTTIATLLAARIDQLPSAERAILERAAIGGEHFFAGAARWLTEAPAASDVDDHLSSLLRKDLIRPERSSLPGEDAYRFRHALIRDAAYEAMPKQVRADLHERYARWLASAVHDGMTEQDEIVGYHLEQAVRYRAELGIELDPMLVRQATRTLVDAAHRSASRFDFLGSAGLLERGAALLRTTIPSASGCWPRRGRRSIGTAIAPALKPSSTPRSMRPAGREMS